MNLRGILAAHCPSSIQPVFNRLASSSIGYRLARGVFWSMAGAVISRGLMFMATVLVARILGKTVYGELGIIQSTVGMFSIFAGFGLGLTTTKYIAEFRQSDPQRAGRIIGLSWFVALITGGVMALGLFLFAPWLAKHSIHAPHLASVLRIAALFLFLSALNSAQTGALSGFESFKTIARVNLIAGLLCFPILIAGAYFGGLPGTVWAMSVNIGINWLLSHFALRKEIRRSGVPLELTHYHWRKELPILWGFSLPATIAGVMVGPIQWACNAMLVNRPDGYGALGIFNAAIIFQQFLLFASGMLSAPLLSILSNVGSAKNVKLETTNILSSWGIGLFPALFLMCFPEVIDVLFGGKFQSRSLRLTFIIVIYYTCILTYRAGLLRVLQSKGLLWLGLWNNVFWAIILLPGAFYFVRWGAVGLALSYAISYTLCSIVFVPIYLNQCGVPRFLLISKEAISIWLVVIGLVIVNVWDIPILLRTLAFPFVLFLSIWNMKGIWRHGLDYDGCANNN